MLVTLRDMVCTGFFVFTGAGVITIWTMWVSMGCQGKKRKKWT